LKLFPVKSSLFPVSTRRLFQQTLVTTQAILLEIGNALSKDIEPPPSNFLNPWNQTQTLK